MTLDNPGQPAAGVHHVYNAHLLDGLFKGPPEKAQNGAHTGAPLSYGIEGGITGCYSGPAAGILKLPALTEATTMSKAIVTRQTGLGILKGFGAATADAGFDMLLQKQFGHNIHGHDLFRPTGLEMFGMGAAVAAPIDIRLKLGLAGVSWLAGRVENYFDA